MNIIIDRSHADKLEAAINAQNGRVRKLESVEQLLQIVNKIDRSIPPTQRKKDIDGTKITYIVGCENFPRAYKYTPEGTEITLIRKSRKWHLTDLSRVPCNRAKNTRIEFSESAKRSIIDYFNNFTL